MARDILTTEDMEVLRTVRRAYRRAVDRSKVKTEKPVAEERTPYTMEELNARMDEAEAEEGGTSGEAFFARMESEMPWLCK